MDHGAVSRRRDKFVADTVIDQRRRNLSRKLNERYREVSLEDISAQSQPVGKKPRRDTSMMKDSILLRAEAQCGERTMCEAKN